MNSERISCRHARRLFGAELADEKATNNFSADNRAALARHLESCARCAQEHRVETLARAALDLAASPERVLPEENFFVALRARIARGPEQSAAPRVEESWSAALWLTARQLAPAMALLLVVIIGLTLFFNGGTPDPGPVPPRDRIVFNDLYEYPNPTTDDVLESLVAVEERENGR